MKRIWKVLSLLLIVVLLAGSVAMTLAGCGNETAAEEEIQLEVDGFQVGFARLKMNPQMSTALTGMGNEKFRYFNNVEDGGMTCSAVAISDAYGNHFMWITSDLMSADDITTSLIKRLIKEKTGIPEENIILTVSHSHSAPTFTRGELEGSSEYKTIVINTHMEAAINAVKDRKPAQLYAGSVETDRMNFIRHYYHVSVDGEIKHFGDNYGTAVYDSTTDHVAEADPTMHLIKFAREGEKDIVVANFRGHSHFSDGHYAYDLSADYIVSFRDALEHYTDDHVMFIQGAAGNTNTQTRLMEESRTNDMRTFGNLLAQHAVDGLDNNMRLVDDPRIEFKNIIFEAEVDHSMDHLLAQASVIRSIWADTGDVNQLSHLLSTDGTGVRTQYHAINIIAKSKMTTEKDGQLQVRVMSLSDDVALCTFPGELFEAVSVAMEESSPFETTMLFGYADHYAGYLPTQQAFEYTCYETDIGRYTPDTAERILETYLELLNELYDRY